MMSAIATLATPVIVAPSLSFTVRLSPSQFFIHILRRPRRNLLQ
jgi:hypothetical protein